jgi:hypothetical protein
LSATGIKDLPDGRVLLETFDFRSEFAFEEFVEWIAEALNVRPRPCGGAEVPAPILFDFEGMTWRAAWSDEYGCHVEGPASQRTNLERMQAALSR